MNGSQASTYACIRGLACATTCTSRLIAKPPPRPHLARPPALRTQKRSDVEPSEAVIERPLGCVKISAGGAKLGDAGVESLIRQLQAAKNTKLRELNLPDNKLTALGVAALAKWLSGPEAPPGLVKLNL